MGEKEKREELKKKILAYKAGRRLKVSQHLGDKKSGNCPRCGRDKYDFHDGRWKACLGCGFGTRMESGIRSVKGAIRRGNDHEYSIQMLLAYTNYIKRLSPLR